MSVIQKTIMLIGSKRRKEEVALFDSGASYSCIHPDLAEELGIVVPLGEPIEAELAEQGKTLRITEEIYLQFRVNGYPLSDGFLVVPHLSEPVIIGASTLQKWRMKLDFEHDEVVIDPRVAHIRLL